MCVQGHWNITSYLIVAVLIFMFALWLVLLVVSSNVGSSLKNAILTVYLHMYFTVVQQHFIIYLF